MAAPAASPPAHPAVRRSVTLPSSLQPSLATPHADDIAAQSLSETLYLHPGAKIVSFAAKARPGSSGLPSFNSPETAGTLPWSSPSERVMAVGPLRVYRLKGSVAFINSGQLLLSLLPKSQCWCVDGQSKFAMQLKMVNYRIELPYDNAADQAAVEEFISVLDGILQYEKTPCPYKRGFTVDLPDEPQSPTPRRSRGPPSKARRWEQDDEGWKPEGEERAPRPLRPPPRESDYFRRPPAPDTNGSSPRSDGDDREKIPPSRSTVSTQRRLLSQTPKPDNIILPKRPQRQEAHRSFTLPAGLSATDTTPSAAPGDVLQEPSMSFEEVTPDNLEDVDAYAEEHETAPVLTQEPAPEPVPELAPQPIREPAPDLVTAATPNPAPDPVSEPVPRLSTQPAPEPTSNLTPEAAVQEPASDPAPALVPEPQHPLDSTPDMAASQTSESSQEPTNTVEAVPKPETQLEPEPGHILAAMPALESKSDSETPPDPEEDEEAVSNQAASPKGSVSSSIRTFHTTNTNFYASPSTSTPSSPPSVDPDSPITPSHVEDQQGSPSRKATSIADPTTPRASQSSSSAPSDDHTTSSSPPTVRRRQPPPLHSIPERQPSPSPTRTSQVSRIHREISPSGNLALGLVSRAMALLTGPPSGLLAAMVQIAARVARGLGDASEGAYRFRRTPARYGMVPGGWEDSETEGAELERDSEDGQWDSADEDDYGVPLGCRTPARDRRKALGRGGADASPTRARPAEEIRKALAKDGDSWLDDGWDLE